MSSVQNGTYGFGTVLTADREALDVEQPSKKARVLPPATSANEAIQFHFVDSWEQVWWLMSIPKLCSFPVLFEAPAVCLVREHSAAVRSKQAVSMRMPPV